jgi:hypothetical protein
MEALGVQAVAAQYLEQVGQEQQVKVVMVAME